MACSAVIATSSPIVQTMCDRVEPRLSDPTQKVFEPGCGDGSFLAETLQRRLAHISSPHALLVACANLYGIDILPSCVTATRSRLRQLIADALPTILLRADDKSPKAQSSSRADAGLSKTRLSSRVVDYRFWPLVDLFLTQNIVLGDFLQNPAELSFTDWRAVAEFQFVGQTQTLAAILREAQDV